MKAWAMTKDNLAIDATPEALAYLSEIAGEMTSLFAISREEAVGRINRCWGDRKKLRTDTQLLLLFHEEPEYWAKHFYYVAGTRWWREGEPLVPRDYP